MIKRGEKNMELYNIQVTLTDNQKKTLEKRAARAGMTNQELIQVLVADMTECNNENYDEWVLLDNWMSRRAKVNIIRYCAEELGDMDYFYKKIWLIEAMKKEIEYIKEDGIFQKRCIHFGTVLEGRERNGCIRLSQD